MRCLRVISVLLFPVLTVAQYQQGFEYVFPVEGTFEDVIPTKNGCIVAGNGRYANPKPIIAAIDSLGNLIWKDSIGSVNFGYAYAVKRDTSGNIFLGGNYEASNGVDDIFLKKYDSAGNTLWNKSYDSPGSFNPDKFRDMLIDNDQNATIVGSGRLSPPYTNPMLLSYNSSGTLVKDTTLLETGTGYFFTLKRSVGGYYGISRKQYGPLTAHLHRFNSNYNHQWRNTLQIYLDGGRSVMDVNSSGYVALGGQRNTSSTAVLAICKPNGDTLLTRNVTTPTIPYGRVENVFMDSTLNIYTLSVHGTLSVITRFDTSGTQYWQDTVPGNNSVRVENRDGFQYINGQLLYANSVGNTALYIYDTTGIRIMKLPYSITGLTNLEISRILSNDSIIYIAGAGKNAAGKYHGFVTCFYDTTSLAPPPPPAALDEIGFKALAFYPNPAQNRLNFKYPVRNVRIFSLTGGEIYRIDEQCSELDISQLAEGAYIITATGLGDELLTGKFIKISGDD